MANTFPVVAGMALAIGSDAGIPFAEPNSDQCGDMHYWDVWHGRKLVFVAELWQGSTKLSTRVSTFAPVKHLELSDPELKVDARLTEGPSPLKFHSNPWRGS